ESVATGPFVMRPWRFAIRASEASWERFWRKVPEPGWHDLFALLRRGDVAFEGGQRVLIADLMYLKLVLAAPRRLAACGRGAAPRAKPGREVARGESDERAHRTRDRPLCAPGAGGEVASPLLRGGGAGDSASLSPHGGVGRPSIPRGAKRS